MWEQVDVVSDQPRSIGCLSHTFFTTIWIDSGGVWVPCFGLCLDDLDDSNVFGGYSTSTCNQQPGENGGSNVDVRGSRVSFSDWFRLGLCPGLLTVPP